MAPARQYHINTIQTEISAFCTGKFVTDNNSLPPFGTYAPNIVQRWIITLTRGLPEGWLGRRLAFALRKLVLVTLRRPLDVKVFEQNMRVHPFANVCEKRVLFTPQFFDLTERTAIADALRDDFTFIDIGANVGAYSLFVASVAKPGTTIIAIEPQPEVFARLTANIRLNPGCAIKAISCAVSDRDGEVSLFLGGQNQGEASIKFVSMSGNGGTSVTVPAKSLVTIASDENLDHIDALKLDVEGAEDLILVPFFSTAPQSLWPRMIILENASQRWQTDCVQLCLDNGYEKTMTTRMNVVLTRQEPS